MKTETAVLTIFFILSFNVSSFTHNASHLGDADCNGIVNVLDVVVTVDYFLALEPDPFCFENADINADGMINVLDLVLMVDIFLNDDPGTGTVIDIDGNEYQTIILGNQEWMAENLRTSSYATGEAIPPDLSNAAWEETTQGAFAIYPHSSISGLNSDEEVLEAYGALYNWYAAFDARGICPAGWQVPTDDDWNDLLSYLNDEHGIPNTNTLGGAGNALKSCRQVDSPLGGECDTSEHPRWNSNASHHGFDQFGFAALPGGYRWTSGSYHYVGLSGFYWSMTESSSTSSWGRYLGNGFGSISQVNYLKNVGFSVRCIKHIDN